MEWMTKRERERDIKRRSKRQRKKSEGRESKMKREIDLERYNGWTRQ